MVRVLRLRKFASRVFSSGPIGFPWKSWSSSLDGSFSSEMVDFEAVFRIKLSLGFTVSAATFTATDSPACLVCSRYRGSLIDRFMFAYSKFSPAPARAFSSPSFSQTAAISISMPLVW